MACYMKLVSIWIIVMLIGNIEVSDSFTLEETKSYGKLPGTDMDDPDIDDDDTQIIHTTQSNSVSDSLVIERYNSSFLNVSDITQSSILYLPEITEISSSFNQFLFSTRDITYYNVTPDMKHLDNYSHLSVPISETILAFDPVQLSAVFHHMTLEALSSDELCNQDNDTNTENEVIGTEKGADEISQVNKMGKSLRKMNCSQQSNLSQISNHSDHSILPHSDSIILNHNDHDITHTYILSDSDHIVLTNSDSLSHTSDRYPLPVIDHYDEFSPEISDSGPNPFHPDTLPHIPIKVVEDPLISNSDIVPFSNDATLNTETTINPNINMNIFTNNTQPKYLFSSTFKSTPTFSWNSIITSVGFHFEETKFHYSTPYFEFSSVNLFTNSYQRPLIKKVDFSPNRHDNVEDPKKKIVTKYFEPKLSPTKSTPKSPGLPVSVPSLYLSVALNMMWVEFCEHQELFKNIIANIIQYSSNERININQVILPNIENSCFLSPDEYSPKIMVDMFMTNKLGEYDADFTQKVFRMIVEEVKITLETPFKNKFIAIHINGKPNSSEVPISSFISTGIIVAISVSCIAGMVLIIIIAVQFLWKRNHFSSFNKKRCTPAKDTRSIDIISIRSSIRMKKFQRSRLRRSYVNRGFDDPDAPSRLLNINTLTSLSKNTELLNEEFKKIPMNMPKINESPPGTEEKNRYANVIPIAETRVSLTVLPGEPNSDYINANFMRGYKNKERCYIACQAPMNNTIYDFWRMVLEYKSETIIMLTAFEEQGLSRCGYYFSISETLDSILIFGNIQVMTKKKDMKEHFVITYLEVENTDTRESLKVTHYWYNIWPIQGMPEDPFSVIKFLHDARLAILNSQGPPIFHCSAGTGRTGVVLACDICMRQYEESQTVNILNCVFKLRQDRGGAVQTKEQYQFIYKAITEYSKWLQTQSSYLNDSARGSISSDNDHDFSQ